LSNRTTPAFLLVGPPGIGKTTVVYRIFKRFGYRLCEFNASHTRSGIAFRKTILPLLKYGGVSEWLRDGNPDKIAVLLDEMDGLSQGEKGGLQELLDYLKSKRNFINDSPLILICNVLEGRIMQQLLKYCCVQYVNMPKKDKLAEFFQKDIPESLYALGDIRKVSQGLLCQGTKEAYEQDKQDELDKNVHIAIRAAWFTLFESWGSSDELDLETKDANLAGLLFHQNLPLFLEKAPIELYEQILEYIRWSDRADFWAFFHQCWNLLPLSYHLKLKYPNQILQAYPKPDKIPELHELVYTQVLTKQSALFNSWKEMNRVSNELNIPFRCISQWATHLKVPEGQKANPLLKLKETLGLPLVLPLLSPTKPSSVSASVAPVAPVVAQNVVVVDTVLKPVIRRKKECVLPS
jgi:hypothetical protein